MTALSQDTHFLSFRKQQIAMPSGKQRMTLSIPEKCKYFCLYQSSEDAPTYGSEGGLYVTTTISTFVPENKQIEIRASDRELVIPISSIIVLKNIFLIKFAQNFTIDI